VYAACVCGVCVCSGVCGVCACVCVRVVCVCVCVWCVWLNKCLPSKGKVAVTVKNLPIHPFTDRL